MLKRFTDKKFLLTNKGVIHFICNFRAYTIMAVTYRILASLKYKIVKKLFIKETSKVTKIIVIKDLITSI